MSDIFMLTRAYLFAAQRHAGQRRKGAAAEPYVNHLAEVADLVATATDGRDAALVAAAVLHDTIEDTGTTSEELTERFGPDVAALVAEVTDDKGLAQDERKRHQVEHAPHLSARAKLLKLADKTSNLRDIARSPPADWGPRRKLEYIRWSNAVAARLRPINPWLEAEFAAASEAVWLPFAIAAGVKAAERDAITKLRARMAQALPDASPEQIDDRLARMLANLLPSRHRDDDPT